MKIWHWAMICVLWWAGCSCGQARRETNFDQGWLFHEGEVSDGAAANCKDERWEHIDVPHDWSIRGKFDKNNPTGKAGAFLPAGIGCYRKYFSLSPTDAGMRVFIDFDGVMANSDVWINGVHLGHRPNGYVSFEYELTPNVHSGKNVLAVKCDNSLQPASRWYAGAGIYRHAHLIVLNPVHLTHWGTFVTTPRVSPAQAMVVMKNSVVNQSAAEQSVRLRCSVIDENGKEIASTDSPAQSIAAGKEAEFDSQLHVNHPVLWNPDRPNLYRARVVVSSGNRITEGKETPFGIREFRFDPSTGFWLNGKNFKLYGCCLHQDAGALGVAVPLGVWQRRLQSLRDIGCNAIRTSHNPPDPAFLDLCDRIGFLVMDEMFDVWTVGKSPLLSRQTLNDYHLYFRDWWKADVTNTVLRDRNHPCVILYSAGNEIHDIRANSNLGFEIFKPLRDLYHQLDPTRPVTLALLRPNQTDVYRNGFADLLDVVGQNYRENELVAAHEAHPNWKIIGTENHLTPDAWRYLRDTPAYAGQFIWTGYDYLGESPGWPIIGSGSGLFDRTGLAKPEAYQAKSWWSKKPVVRIARMAVNPELSDLPPAEPGMDTGPRRRHRLVSDWTIRDASGTPQHVEVFTNCDQVELFLNDKSLGIQQRSPDDEPLIWDVPFAAGTLRAVGRDKGAVAAAHELHTAGKPTRVILSVDQPTLKADWNDVAYVRASIVDDHGTTVPDAKALVQFDAVGPGYIQAVDSGDNMDTAPFAATRRRAYMGSCVAIIKANGGGTIRISASAAGLSGGAITIEAKQ